MTIWRLLEEGAYLFKGIFAQFINMQEKKILASVMKSKKKNFSEIINRIHNNVWYFYPTWKLIISEKCVVTPDFLFGFQ